MAIIVNQVPTNGQSAHFPLWHVVNTDLVGDPTLRVVFEVFIAGVLVYTAKVYPPPNMGTNAFFDASPIIRNYMSKYFTPINFMDSINTDLIFIEYVVKYGEEWVPSTGVPTGNYQQFTSTIKAYNSYPEHLQDSLVITTNLESTWLTQRHLNVDFPMRMAQGQSFFIPYLRSPSITIVNVNLHFYTAVNGTSLGTVTKNFTGVKKLLNLRLSEATYGTPPAGTGAILLEIDNGAFTAPQIWFEYVCEARHKPIQLTFLNRYGGYESFCFDLVNKQRIDIERQMYAPSEWVKKSIPFVIPAPDPSVYVGSVSNYDSATKVYNPTSIQQSTKQKLSYKLTSDYVTETNYNWLKQLIASPSVYMEQNGYFYPVIVKDAVWEQKKAISDMLFNLELSVESFANINSQFQ